MRHHSKQIVRWDDLDAFGHLNNATYLTIIQEARADLTWYSRKPCLLYTSPSPRDS